MEAISKLRKSPVYSVALWVLVVLLCVVLVSIAVPRFQQPNFLYYDDYVEYWAAGRLNLRRGNPYSPSELLGLQIAIGRLENVPLMMWNPPWTLAIIMPFAVLSYPTSRLAWFLFSIIVILLSVDWLWRYSGGSPRLKWIAYLIALTFGPALHTLKLGQITPILMLGVVGFLRSVDRERWVQAGAAMALLSIKPHLIYLPAFVIGLWILHTRRFSVVTGFSLVILAALCASWLVNPALLNGYLVAVTSYPPGQWLTPTLGGLLRLHTGPHLFILQSIPALVVCIWALHYWWCRRNRWRWAEQMPLLILVSAATAPYGWNHDQIVSLLAIIPVVASQDQTMPRLLKGGLVGLYVLVNGIVLFAVMEQIAFWWLAPWTLTWWWVASRFGGLRSAMVGIGENEQTI